MAKEYQMRIAELNCLNVCPTRYANRHATSPSPKGLDLSLSEPTAPQLQRQIGLFDATMVVMGGIVGSGIFINPYVVAQRVHSPVLILAVWIAGGVVAILGAFIYAELADRLPAVGGQYAYLRDAWHPAAGFLYGWALLLVVQTGGMAAVTVTFAQYFLELTHLNISDRWVVVLTLAVLTTINCLGVKAGTRLQSTLMLLKIAAIACLVGAGLFLVSKPQPILHPVLDRPISLDLLTAIGAAMVPVLFSYGGWQTTNFIAAEIKDPRRNLGRALIIGVSCVIALYLLVSLVCVRVLGASALAETRVPASAVMRVVSGEGGARLIALGIAVSTFGFLSQGILTAPRVYFAMANDGLFFKSVAFVSRKTGVPIVAILMQSIWALLIAFTGKYEQILNFMIPIDFFFFGLSATCLFVFRRRERGIPNPQAGFRVPGHPYTTILFVLACWSVVANTLYKYPQNSLVGVGILLMGLPVYAFWAKRKTLIR
jgi:APA family basic amino acid/polyamine antiporter